MLDCQEICWDQQSAWHDSLPWTIYDQQTSCMMSGCQYAWKSFRTTACTAWQSARNYLRSTDNLHDVSGCQDILKSTVCMASQSARKPLSTASHGRPADNALVSGIDRLPLVTSISTGVYRRAAAAACCCCYYCQCCCCCCCWCCCCCTNQHSYTSLSIFQDAI